MDKKLQKQILKFIREKYGSNNIVNDISVEFKERGYKQEIIDKNLYCLAKNNKISSGREIDDMNHKVYSPLFILDEGNEDLKIWYKKYFITILTLICVIIGAIFSILNFLKY